MGAFDQRPRFYEGQYLTAADLSAVVDYLRTSQARQMLGAGTWGIGIGLTLVERNAPGAPNRKEVILQPGWARDGFGRHLVVQQPTRLPESLFAGIAYNASLDDPAHPGGPPGRLVKVWLAATERGGQQAAPGFETCDQADSFSRVEEGVDFVIGTPPLVGQRAPVLIGAETVDAREALIRFDASAPPLYDTSVPHQTFSFAADGKPPRWLVPLGFVRWIATSAGGGYFVDRQLVATDNVVEQIRAARRYGGTVTESIEAADGAIVLRRRSDAPDAPHRFAALLTSGQPLAALLEDLAWVEGNLRVEGDAKLAGSRLLLRNADGLDEGTGLFLARSGDGNVTPGARQLRAVIGPDSQTDNRFVVGPETAAVPPDQKPVLVVQSNARVGVNQLTPERTLHAKGDAIRIEDAAGQKRLEMRTDGAAVDLQSDTHALYIRSSGPAATHRNQVVINPVKGVDGEVGIGTGAPAYGLDVDEAAVRFKLDSGNGGQLLLRSEALAAARDKVYLEAGNGAGNAPSPELRITGPLNANLPTVAAFADVTYLRGKLGVNEPAPAAEVQVHMRGPRLRLQSTDSARSIDLRTDGSAVDLQTTTSHLYLRSSTPAGPPTRHIVMNPYPEDGNVGVGTTAPLEKLHVAGSFIRVDGAGQEQAYIGGDGSMTVYGGWPFPAPDVQIGSFNPAVHAVHCWNAGANRWMDLICDNTYELSDEAAKTDIRPLGGGLERLRKMRGVSYRMKDDPGSRLRVGVVAQEIASVLPEAVTQSSRGAAVAYSSFVPLLIEAIKELAVKVEALQAEIEALKARRNAPAAAPVPVPVPAVKAPRPSGKKR
jgi:hypothetical protein